jgi:hypothetical protein
MEKIKKFLKEEDGVTAIEYTLIAAVIALVIVACKANYTSPCPSFGRQGGVQSTTLSGICKGGNKGSRMEC